MLNPIRFSGLSLNKDELTVDNGELAVCAGLELKDGFVRPSVLSGTNIGNLIYNGLTVNLLYVHVTGIYTHYLGCMTGNNNTLVWFSKTDSDELSEASTVNVSMNLSQLKDIDSVGNTLVISDSQGELHYIIWRNGTYEELPQKPPMIDIAFRLGDDQVEKYPIDSDHAGVVPNGSWAGYRSLETSLSTVFDVSGSKISIKDDYKSLVQNSAWALFNECNSIISKQGRFYAPFMIRYCYRMFDGSYFMHSAPVYIPVIQDALAPVTIANLNPKVTQADTFFSNTYKTNYPEGKNKDVVVSIYMKPDSKAILRYAPLSCALEYKIINDNSFSQGISKWKDVIKSVDIFITPPLTTLTTTREIEGFHDVYGLDIEQYTSGKRSSYNKSFKTAVKISDDSVNRDMSTSDVTCLTLPVLSKDKFFDNVRNTSTFFLLKSIDINNISDRISDTSSGFAKLDVDSAVVNNIEVQKQLTDDYKTHNLLKSDGSYVYNHRINMWGVKEKLFEGFSAPVIAPWIDKESRSFDYKIWEIRVNIHTDNGNFIVSADTPDAWKTAVGSDHFKDLLLFYPDSRATKMWIIYSLASSTQKYSHEVEMEESFALNGAWTKGDLTLASAYDSMNLDEVCPVSSSVWVDIPSKVYTSSMDNPFHFPLTGINTVGTGNIISLASATRALSQGQFGQFPLIAFCSDGIWALEVSPTGTYSSIHPISRDVATSADGVCMLDQAIIYITARGANILQGSDVASVSDALVGVAPGMIDPTHPASLFPEMLEDVAKIFSTSDATKLTSLISVTEAPIKFMQHAIAVNDSTNHRVLFIDKNNSGIALVLSLDAMTWSYMSVPVNMTYCQGYPYAYITSPAGTTGNILTRLDTQYDYLSTVRYPGMLLTRTLSFSGMYSAITGFRQSHSVVPGSDEKLLPHLYIYGSNDLRSWHYIGHTVANNQSYMPSHSFRYFRVGLLLSMRPSEQYLQITLDVTDKYNRL